MAGMMAKIQLALCKTLLLFAKDELVKITVVNVTMIIEVIKAKIRETDILHLSKKGVNDVRQTDMYTHKAMR